MKKIAFVISSLDYGGAQRAVSSITMGLPDDYIIDIILNDDAHIVYPHRGTIHSLGVPIPSNRNSLPYQLRIFLKRICWLRKIKKTGDYDAVISFLDSANIANLLSGRKKSKIIISVRNNLSEKKSWGNKLVFFPLVRLLYNKADLLVSLSEGVKDDLIRNFHIREEKIKVIYNGYDVNSIKLKAEEPSEVKVDKSFVNFATMGRQTAQKGQWHLIRAFAELYKQNHAIRLYILGIGELEEYMRSLVDGYGLADAVFFTGFVHNSYAVLKQMDVFVFPSLWEGFGNALVEAMTCGLPCISTDYKYGAREILGSGNEYGIITPCMTGERYTCSDNLEEAEQALKNEMEKLVLDDGLRKYYAEKSMERAEYFSINKAVKNWESIL